MDNKLSELSKPVGFIEQGGMDYLRSGADADIWPDGGRGDDIPLYSQEYVSALLADNEYMRWRIKEIGNELGCNPDNESIMMAIDKLKERLATPVRLSQRYETAGYCIDEHYCQKAADGDYLDRDELIASLREQGFTVEGDE